MENNLGTVSKFVGPAPDPASNPSVSDPFPDPCSLLTCPWYRSCPRPDFPRNNSANSSHTPVQLCSILPFSCSTRAFPFPSFPYQILPFLRPFHRRLPSALRCVPVECDAPRLHWPCPVKAFFQLFRNLFHRCQSQPASLHIAGTDKLAQKMVGGGGGGS